jgi:hypothetical protein
VSGRSVQVFAVAVADRDIIFYSDQSYSYLHYCCWYTTRAWGH